MPQGRTGPDPLDKLFEPEGVKSLNQPEFGLLVSHLHSLASLPLWDTASVTPALKSSGVSGLFSPENSEGFLLVGGCCDVWCKSL